MAGRTTGDERLPSVANFKIHWRPMRRHSTGTGTSGIIWQAACNTDCVYAIGIAKNKISDYS
jgi:hypothetical protein